jgi:hypothetical protein
VLDIATAVCHNGYMSTTTTTNTLSAETIALRFENERDARIIAALRKTCGDGCCLPVKHDDRCMLQDGTRFGKQ